MGLVIAACLGQPRPQAQEGNQGVKSRLLRGQAAVGRAERPDAPGWSSLESGRRSMDCGPAVCGMSMAQSCCLWNEHGILYPQSF